MNTESRQVNKIEPEASSIVFSFKLRSDDFEIIQIENEIELAEYFLRLAELPIFSYPLSLTTPFKNGPTSDTRNHKASVSFKHENQTESEVIIRAHISENYEYWYYGSISDDWTPAHRSEIVYLVFSLSNNGSLSYRNLSEADFKKSINHKDTF